MAAEIGARWSIKEAWNTLYYKEEELESAEFVLPQGVEVKEDKFGDKYFCKNGEQMELVTEDDLTVWLVGSEMIQLKKSIKTPTFRRNPAEDLHNKTASTELSSTCGYCLVTPVGFGGCFAVICLTCVLLCIISWLCRPCRLCCPLFFRILACCLRTKSQKSAQRLSSFGDLSRSIC